MKKTIAKAFFLSLVVTACSLGDNTPDNLEPVIDPPMETRFAFDEEGVPYLEGQSRELPEETQQNFARQVVGYGWEWVQTHEIKADGWPRIDNYYQGIYGIGPSHFYVETEWEAVEYFHSDANNRDVFRRQPICIDATYGRIFFKPQLIEPPYTRRFDTFMIFEFEGTWHIVGVEYLGQRTEQGVMRDVWGWSEYKRMTAERLEEVRTKYSIDATPQPEPDEVAARNVSNSRCKERISDATRASIEDGEYIEYQAVKGDDGQLYLHFNHVNVYFNCALSRVYCTATLDGSSITIDEKEGMPGDLAADCLCPYDVTFDVGPLAPGHYTIAIRQYGDFVPPRTEFDIDLTEDLEGRKEFL